MSCAHAEILLQVEQNRYYRERQCKSTTQELISKLTCLLGIYMHNTIVHSLMDACV